MKLRTGLLAAVAAAAIAVAAPVQAKEFKFAFQGDLSSLDPHSLNESFLLGTLGNIYEGLVLYDADMLVIPGLAESWKTVTPTTWEFKLRKGVKFHGGQDFTADDVIFTWQRAGSKGSDQKTRAGKIKNITKVDDYTILVETPAPNPILTRDLNFLYIMDKEWSEANGTTNATSATGDDKGNFANLNANGTGPFMVKSNQADVKTVMIRNENYWKEIPSNVTQIDFTPIKEQFRVLARLCAVETGCVMVWTMEGSGRLLIGGIAPR